MSKHALGYRAAVPGERGAWGTPPSPDPLTTRLWLRFCRTIDQRIEAVRRADDVDRARVIARRAGRAA